MAFHAIKAGEGDVFISAGVETVSRFRKGTRTTSDTENPLADAVAHRGGQGGRTGGPAREGNLPTPIAMGQPPVSRARGSPP
jgi:acetyl-CoA C-acetyltransferase